MSSSLFVVPAVASENAVLHVDPTGGFVHAELSRDGSTLFTLRNGGGYWFAGDEGVIQYNAGFPTKSISLDDSNRIAAYFEYLSSGAAMPGVSGRFFVGLPGSLADARGPDLANGVDHVDPFERHSLTRDGRLFVEINNALYEYKNETWHRIIGPGDIAPGLGNESRLDSISAVMGLDGRVAFVSRATAPGINSELGIWVADDDGVHLVVLSGKLSADSPEWTSIGAPSYLQLIPARDGVYFYGGRRLPGETEFDEGVWFWNGASIESVLLKGASLDDGIVVEFVALSDANADAGVAMLTFGRHPAASNTTGDRESISRIVAGHRNKLSTIVATGDHAPGTDARFDRIESCVMNRIGTIAFDASIVGPNVINSRTVDSYPNNRGIWGGDADNGIALIVRTGTVISVAADDMRTTIWANVPSPVYTLLDTSHRVINDSNQLLCLVGFDAVPTRFSAMPALLRARVPENREAVRTTSDRVESEDEQPQAGSGTVTSGACPALSSLMLGAITIGLFQSWRHRRSRSTIL